MEKTIITASLTGAVTPAGYNIHETPEEIAACAYECWKLGAAIVHLHMRDDQGLGVMDKDRFAETIRLIRAHEDCDVIINCTSSGSNTLLPPEKRMEHFATIPEIELGSFDAGTINWDCMGIFLNDPPFLLKLAECYEKYHVKPEIELFDAGMIANMNYYIKTGVLKEPVWCQLVMNVLGGAPGTVENLVHLVNQLPKGAMWSCTGIGASHVPMMFTTLASSNHFHLFFSLKYYFLIPNFHFHHHPPLFFS